MANKGPWQNRCHHCHVHIRNVRGGYVDCKWLPLCKRVDVTLLDEHRGSTIDEFDSLFALIRRGSTAASAAIAIETSFPKSGEEFLALLRRLHRLIFSEAAPTRAGRFRAIGEDVEVGRGRAPRHLFRGADPARIESALIALHDRSAMADLGSLSEIGAAYRCGKFLEEFFRIHPFMDGNGRVGRMILQLALRGGGFHVRPWETQGKWRRKYERGLEYAHEHCASPRPNAYEHIARYIAHHISRVSEDDLIEAGPPGAANDDVSRITTPEK